jgi:hypothetical protein
MKRGIIDTIFKSAVFGFIPKSALFSGIYPFGLGMMAFPAATTMAVCHR